MKAPNSEEPRSDVSTDAKLARSRKGVVVGIALASLTVGLVAVGFHWMRESAEIKRRAVAELTAIANLKLTQIVNWREERVGDGRFFARAPFVTKDVQTLLADPNAEPTRTEALEWLTLLKGGDRYEQIIIFRPDGSKLIGISSHPGEGEKQAPAPEVAAALAATSSVLTDLHRDGDGAPHMDVLVPVMAGQPKAIAAIVLRLNPEHFLYPLLQQWPLPSSTAETVLARREGNEVIFLNQLRHREGAAMDLRLPADSPSLPLALAVNGYSGPVEARDYRGEPVVAVVQPVPDSPWFLNVKMDRAEIYAPLRAQAINSGIIALALTCAVLGSAAWLWRREEARLLRRELVTESALIDTGRKYRQYVENSPVGIFVLDAQGRFVEANPEACRISGLSLEETLKRGISDLLAPQSMMDGLRFFAEVQQTGRVLAEVLIKREDGPRQVKVHGVKLSEDRFMGIVDDVTERRRADEESRRWQRVFDAAQFGLAYADAGKMSYVAANSTFAEQRGYTREEMAGRSILDIYPASEHRRLLLLMEEIGRKGHLVFETVHQRKDGSCFPVLMEATVVHDEAGQPTFRVVYALDITDRKRIEDALRESQERFSELAENVGEVFWIVAPEDGRFFYVSPAYERIWGRTCESVYDDPQSWIEAVHPEDRERLGGHLRANVTDSPVEETFRILRPDGTVRWIRDRAFPVRDAEGRLIRIVGVAQDVTESRQMEAQFRQAQKMEAVGQLAGGVAHDFNNILSIITVHTDLLTEALPEGDPTRESLMEVQRAAERATALTRQLLVFSRQQVVEPKVIDLNAQVTDSERMLRRLIGEDVRLTTALAPDLAAVKMDPGQLGQVIMNLAVNARDAMPKGGQLTIETRNVQLDANYTKTHADTQAGPHVLLAITDTGEGMPAEVQARIFEPFFTTKGVGRGTGLGLAVVHGIVKQAGGHLGVYSEPGVGTTFKIYLPALVDQVAALSAYEKTTTARGKETILLVDDEQPILRVTAAALDHLGYTVISATSGRQALELAAKHEGQIDLLLADVVMPVMSGRELAEALLERYPAIRVLFQSGYTDDAVVRHGILLAEVAFLQKPFTLSSLATKIREVLDQR